MLSQASESFKLKKQCEKILHQDRFECRNQSQNAKTKKLNFSNQLPMISVFCFICLIISANSQTSIPVEPYRNPNIESRVIQLLITSPTTRQVTMIFSKAMVTVPAVQNMFFAFESFRYDCNYLLTGKYMVSFSAPIVVDIQQTQLTVGLGFMATKVKIMKLSVLIFTNEYQNINQIQSFSASFYDGTVKWVTISDPYPIVVPFMQRMILEVSNGIALFQYQTNVQYVNSRTQLRLSVSFPVSYITAAVGMRFLIIYPALMNAMVKPLIFQYNHISGTGSYFTKILTNYIQTKSALFFGANHLSYTPQNSPLDRGMAWITTFPYTSINTIKVTLDNMINSFQYEFLIINSYGCPNITYPYKVYDSASTSYLCLKECPYRYFGYYSTVYNQYTCETCSDASCIKCDSLTVCKECTVGYRLNELMSCVIDDGYFLNASGLYQCDTPVPNCAKCSSDGLTCLECKVGYALELNACKDCLLVSSHCVKCTPQYCLSCISPYQLKQPLVCQIPVPPLPVPPPPQPVCSSQSCQRCMASNVRFCLECKSSTKYILLQGECLEIKCGDFKIDPNEQCDDGNTLSMDGCSQACDKVEEGWVCDEVSKNDKNFPTLLKSLCYYQKTIEFQTKRVVKDPQGNRVKVLMKNKASNLRVWQEIQSEVLLKMFKFDWKDLSEEMKSKVSYRIEFVRNIQGGQIRFLQQASYKPSDYQHLLLTISYQTSKINHQQLAVEFSPTHYYTSTPYHFKFQALSHPSLVSSETQFNLISQNNLKIQYHPQTFYARDLTIIRVLSTMIVGLVWLMVGAALVGLCLDFKDHSKKNGLKVMIVLEIIGIVQLAYWSLMGVGQISAPLYVMALALKNSNGFDLTAESGLVDRELMGIGVTSSNISNTLNISLLLVLLPLIISLILAIVLKIKKPKPLQTEPHPSNNQKQGQTFSNNVQTAKKEQKQPKQKQAQPAKILFSEQFATKVLIGGFGFLLLNVFLFKFIIGSGIQIKKISLMNALDLVFIVLIGLLVAFYLVSIAAKTSWLNICLKSKPQYQNLKSPQSNIKGNNQSGFSQNSQLQLPTIRLYLFIIIFSPIINSIVLTLLSSSAFWHVCPIVICLLTIFLLNKFDIYINQRAQKIRFNINYAAILIIQTMLMVRHYKVTKEQFSTEEQQITIGFIWTILTILLLITINSLVYLIYSIKRIRCCKLQIDWNKRKIQNKTRQNCENLIPDTQIQGMRRNDYNEPNHAPSYQSQSHMIKNNYSSHKTKLQHPENQNWSIIDAINEDKDAHLQNLKTSFNLIHRIPPFISFNRQQKNLSQQQASSPIDHRQIKKQIKDSLMKNKIHQKKQNPKNSDSNSEQKLIPTKKSDYIYTDSSKYIVYEEFDKI